MTSGYAGGDAWSTPFAAMRQLRAAWPSRGWSWDTRLSCLSSSFSVELEPKARAAVLLALATEWTPSTVQRAPASLQDVAGRTGGLRPGQMLFSSGAVGSSLSSFAYGLWWPWGDGMTTSTRIGLCGSQATEAAFQRLRELFGVEL